jgi:hypothetical protein
VLATALWALLIAAPPPAAPAPPAGYRAEIEAWRRDREQQLRAPDGWLALVGLTWLHPGANRFGAGPDDDVPLPAPAPRHAGTLLVDGATVRVSLSPGVSGTRNGRPWLAAAGAGAAPTPLRTDTTAGGPDVLGFGGVTLQVIERGGRLGARVKDPQSPRRVHFAGLAWFPVAPEYHAVARLAAHDKAVEIVVPDASGGKQRLESPGTLSFTLAGKALRLDPVRDGGDDADLLVVFRDETTGRETYGAGRFLRARRRPDGSYDLDFNRAYSPPCAYTPYATCPLPPPQNKLGMRVPAGEKTPPGHER